MHPSTGPQGWHLASHEPPCCRVYGTRVCTGALRSLSCFAGCASHVSLLSMPRRGRLLSALGQQGLSLLRQGAETQESAWDNQIWTADSCCLRHQPSSRVGFCSRQGHSIQLQGIPGLVWRSAVFWQRLPWWIERLERAQQRSSRRSGRRLAIRLQQFEEDLVGYVDIPFRSAWRCTTEGGHPLGPRLLARTHDCGACELSCPPGASSSLAFLGRTRPCVVVVVARVVAVGQQSDGRVEKRGGGVQTRTKVHWPYQPKQQPYSIVAGMFSTDCVQALPCTQELHNLHHRLCTRAAVCPPDTYVYGYQVHTWRSAYSCNWSLIRCSRGEACRPVSSESIRVDGDLSVRLWTCRISGKRST